MKKVSLIIAVILVIAMLTGAASAEQRSQMQLFHYIKIVIGRRPVCSDRNLHAFVIKLLDRCDAAAQFQV